MKIVKGHMDIEFVFFHVGEDISLPSSLVSSIKQTNPKSTILQLTDLVSPEVNGVNEVHRYQLPTEFIMMARSEAYANLPSSTNLRVFLDTDMLVVNELQTQEFQETCDVYFCRRFYDTDRPVNIDFRDMAMHEYSGVTMGEAWPFLGCFIASRDSTYLGKIHGEMKRLDSKYQKWYGDQIALAKLARQGYANVGEVSEEVYAHLYDGNLEKLMSSIFQGAVKIIHFKGIRKQHLQKVAMAIFG